ncbi:MAG: Smr/MutS family protein [Desulfuromonadales bacterium]|nr:Smr/MutS family protein [Desulfuromonadales bacterium]
MAKKKQSAPVKKQTFNSDPFSDLKGFSVPGKVEQKQPDPPAVPESADIYGSFANEMELLGVKPIDSVTDEEDDCSRVEAEASQPVVSQSDEDVFLQAMGELQVNFREHLPEDEVPSSALPRRMKQLRQGTLIPEASLDLHGLLRTDVAEKIRFFLQDAQFQGWQTLLIITGKGLHSSDGEPVLRNEAELFLNTEGKKMVAEWGRAPKQYGGEGALVVFLRKK